MLQLTLIMQVIWSMTPTTKESNSLKLMKRMIQSILNSMTFSPPVLLVRLSCIEFPILLLQMSTIVKIAQILYLELILEPPRAAIFMNRLHLALQPVMIQEIQTAWAVFSLQMMICLRPSRELIYLQLQELPAPPLDSHQMTQLNMLIKKLHLFTKMEMAITKLILQLGLSKVIL